MSASHSGSGEPSKALLSTPRNITMFGNKQVLPLTHDERLRNHMSVFTETLKGLEELSADLSTEITVHESKLTELQKTHKQTQEAIQRVKAFTG